MKPGLLNCWLLPFLLVSVLVTTTLKADEWDENYEQGIDLMERGDWELAIPLLQNSVQLEPNPDPQAATSNLKLIQYLPYFYLGKAYFFSGSHALAVASFDKSLDAGAIVRTTQLRKLQQMRSMASELLKATESRSALEARKTASFLEIGQIEQLILSGELPATANQLRLLQATYPKDPRLPVLAVWLQKEQQRVAKAAELTARKTETSLVFESGLDHFLSGQYNRAISAFRQALKLEPNLSAAQSWIARAETEVERLGADEKFVSPAPRLEPEIIERIITQTTAPVFAIPMESVTETRSNTLRLSGRAGDDKGISYISLSLNGQPFADSTGKQIQIRPTPAEDARKFSFALQVPLQMGENQIILTAYDRDSLQNRAVEHLTVTRKAPLYKTTTFGVSVAAVVLLAVGGVFLSRFIKYRIAIVGKYNPYIAGAPIRTQEMFFGREKLLKKIMNTVHNNSMMIHGPRRIGKTSLQHQLHLRLAQAADPDYEFIPVMIDLQGTSEKRFFYHLMEEIIETCKPKLNGNTTFRFSQKKETYSGRDLSWDLKTLLKILGEATDKKVKLVLQIDEVDELNKYSEQVNQKLRSVFMKTFAENLVAVMSGAYIKKNWESEGSPWYNFFEEIEVPPFDQEDAQKLIKQPIVGIYSYEDKAVQKIIERSDCKPYIIQKLCVQVINHIIEHKRRRVSTDDVDAVAEQVLQSVAV